MTTNRGRSYMRSVRRSEKPEVDGPTPSRPISAALDEMDEVAAFSRQRMRVQASHAVIKKEY